MMKMKKRWSNLGLALPLLVIACVKPDQNTLGSEPARENKNGQLDADHGGARISLPEIDFAALAKAGKDSSASDTTAQGFFELTISGENMSELFFQFPLRKKSSQSFDIKGIPSGAKRIFHGRLYTRDYRLTHEGRTMADIKGGVMSDVHLYLSKASGGANVCVVIEGQKPPACALDTLPPVDTMPIPPTPVFDSVIPCWYISSDSVAGYMSLFQSPVNGDMGQITTTNGTKLHISTWSFRNDSLSVIVIRPSLDKKWILSGPVTQGPLWSATGMGYPMESPFLLFGKQATCIDTTPRPPIDTLPPKDTIPTQPPRDSVNGGIIPLPISSAGETTLCFEIRFDYPGTCELSGFAKMGFLAGTLTRGYIHVADKPYREYSVNYGSTDQTANSIRILSTRPTTGSHPADTLDLQGTISNSRTMAKGDYYRLPSMTKGNWTMKSVVCANWTPTYPDSTCFMQ